eukprot:c6491_g1_i3.p1 GENE.c6491_g1_i3~~c6491_g1_i3.p1  ORF type:complete len:421 (-),score=118.31 c6491_g1_i3:42-1304(-)
MAYRLHEHIDGVIDNRFAQTVVMSCLTEDSKVRLLLATPSNLEGTTDEWRLQLSISYISQSTLLKLIEFLISDDQTTNDSGSSNDHRLYWRNDLLISALVRLIELTETSRQSFVKISNLEKNPQAVLEEILEQRWGRYRVQDALIRFVGTHNHHAIACVCRLANEWKQALEHSFLALEKGGIGSDSERGISRTWTSADVLVVVNKHVCPSGMVSVTAENLREMMVMVFGFWKVHVLDVNVLETWVTEHLDQLQHTVAGIFLMWNESMKREHSTHTNSDWKDILVALQLIEKFSGRFVHRIAADFVATTQSEADQSLSNALWESMMRSVSNHLEHSRKIVVPHSRLAQFKSTVQSQHAAMEVVIFSCGHIIPINELRIDLFSKQLGEGGSRTHSHRSRRVVCGACPSCIERSMVPEAATVV